MDTGLFLSHNGPGDHRAVFRPGALGLEMTGYGPSLFGNRLVRTRMLGGEGAGGEKPPATRLDIRCFDVGLPVPVVINLTLLSLWATM
jgi:hypothetical protein